MPMDPEVRRLRGEWPVLILRVCDYMNTVPAEGVPLIEFERACLRDVFPGAYPNIVRALKSKKLIWLVRDGVAHRVFREKPSSCRFKPAENDRLAPFLRALAPHMDRLARVASAEDVDDRERKRRELEAVRQIAPLVRRHEARGLDLRELREGIARTFHPLPVGVLWQREPTLRLDSAVKEIPKTKKKTKLILNGFDPMSKIVALIEKAGQRGIVKTDLLRSVQPRIAAAEFDAMLAEIEETEIIVSRMMKLGVRSHAGRRYFHQKFGMPNVYNGIAKSH